MQSPLLQVDGLTINFETANGFFSAVKDVSFQLNSGETLAIVGESGSGKSLTALCILQLLSSKASIKGNIIFRRDAQTVIPLHDPSANAKFHYRGKDIAMIFQEPMTALNPVYTCGNQVIESILLHQQLDKKAAKAATIELFKKVELPNPEAMFNRYPHELSGGQKQRVMIAMAISGNPSLLIADEPTTALDVTVQKSIITLLQSLQQQMGMAIIFITHDLGLVADIANKVLVMQNGVAVEMGETASVFNAPKALYTQALLACRVAIYEKGQRLPVVAQWLSGITPSVSTPAEVSVSNPTLYPSTPILQVKDLEVGYTTKSSIFKRQSATFFKAVNGVSFDVFEGETVGLVGESGCGKTTVGKAILQLIQANKGSIILKGTELNTLSGAPLRTMRKNLQIVFQDPYGSLNPRLTIGSAIEEPIRLHEPGLKDAYYKQQVFDLLERVELKAEHFNRYPHEFSGGQRQRICIARALALHPAFLIFDESVSALDVSIQAQILNLINDLKADFKFSSLFITHDLSVVKYISDRILVMQSGNIIEQGNALEVFQNPQQAYTKKLIDAIPGKRFLKSNQ